MPKRTTEFQTIVQFVRKHTADAGVTVTESKMLHDGQLGVDREVDVVIEGTFDGDQSVTSIEVIEHGRPAPVTWVEQQIAKHRHLPTNRLVLVSRSGFTKTALQAVANEGGWVDALQPEIVVKDGAPVIKRLYADKIELRPTTCRLVVVPPNRDPIVVRVEPDHLVVDRSGQPIDSTLRLAREALRLDWLARRFLETAHKRADREDLKGFSCGLPLADCGYFLHHEESDELHHITMIELTGEFVFAQDELAFTVAKIGGRVYGAGRGPLLGRDSVWVGTTDEVAQTTTISWKALDTTDAESRGGETDTEIRFRCLLDIAPPSNWAEQEADDGIVQFAAPDADPPALRG